VRGEEHRLGDSAEPVDDLPLLQRCSAALQVDNDLSTYTTENVARDLDDVRAAFGWSQINLFGISYGTRLALYYDRLFPGRARALVLDGVVPFEMVVGEEDNAAHDRKCAGAQQEEPGSQPTRSVPRPTHCGVGSFWFHDLSQAFSHSGRAALRGCVFRRLGSTAADFSRGPISSANICSCSRKSWRNSGEGGLVSRAIFGSAGSLEAIFKAKMTNQVAASPPQATG
jgi:pimeloyl-ACP methyl ester carboxylesterase